MFSGEADLSQQQQTKEQPEHQGKAWSIEEEQRLYDAFCSGVTIQACMNAHGRTRGGIRSRLRQLGLIDIDDNIIMPRPVFAASASSQKRSLKAASKPKRKFVRKPEDKSFSPELNERFKDALRLMEESDHNLFITGKAGTGKSTLLSYFCRTTAKQPVVLAPTGVAALNVKGQTIHSFFNFYVDVTPEKIRTKKSKPRNAKLFKKLRTVVIDEVSMVRADILDCIDVFLRMYGPDPVQPFGGVQMIFVGDLYQLPPVVTSQERELFSSHYETPYFFSAHVLKHATGKAALKLIELEKVYRQKDHDFVELLNRIRNNSIDDDDIDHINSRLIKGEGERNSDFSITLATTNAVADGINESRLAALKGRSYNASANLEGTFGREYFPTAPELAYKIGAQIMLLNNDIEKRWVNGSIGIILDIKEDDDGQEYMKVRLQDNNAVVEVRPHTWEVYNFGVEDNEIVSEPAGTFTQYPFRLAWAITVHKSQGKTFNKVVVDVGRGAFAAGQIYVALSRCTSFAGLTLKTPIRASDIRTDQRILDFFAGHRDDADSVAQALPAPVKEATEKIAFIRQAIAEKTALDILYLKADDTETSCVVVPLHVGPATYQGQGYDGMKALCAPDDTARMFRVDRILRIKKVG
jgi:DNA replication protein DnaC